MFYLYICKIVIFSTHIQNMAMGAMEAMGAMGTLGRAIGAMGAIFPV